MMVRTLDRRTFLSRVALGGAAAALPLGCGPAAGLTLDENAGREKLYLSACESRTAHEQLVQELVARLDGADARISPEAHARNVEQVKAMACPVCGCQLGASQPYPTRF